MGKVLIFNLDILKQNQMNKLLKEMGIDSLIVGKQCQSSSLLSLLANKPDHNVTNKPFSNELLVFYDLSDGVLDILLAKMKQNGLVVPLKAMITKTNITWSSQKLNEELIREHLMYSK